MARRSARSVEPGRHEDLASRRRQGGQMGAPGPRRRRIRDRRRLPRERRKRIQLKRRNARSMVAAINEFAPSQMVIIAGDTVTWTNYGPSAMPHTVSGFASTPDAMPQALSPFQPGCITSSGELQLPPTGSFPPDIWNTCPGAEVNNLTEASQPSAPSGDPYTDGERTSGILLTRSTWTRRSALAFPLRAATASPSRTPGPTPTSAPSIPA